MKKLDVFSKNSETAFSQLGWGNGFDMSKHRFFYDVSNESTL